MKDKIMKNKKEKLKDLDEEHSYRRIFINNDSSPLNRKENDRLSKKLYNLKRQNEGNGDVYKMEKGKLYKNRDVIDQFNIANSIF